MSFAPENYGLDEIVTVETEEALTLKWEWRVNRETGTKTLVGVKAVGMGNAINQRFLSENLPDTAEAEAAAMIDGLIAEEKKAQQERDEITDAENSMWIGGRY